jgi:hypothetical protein
MAGEFRLDGASAYATNMCALLVALPSNNWWDGAAWVALSGISEATVNAGAVAGSKEVTSDANWTGTWLFSLPGTAPPANTISVRAFANPGTTPTWTANILQYVGTADYWVALPAQIPGGGSFPTLAQIAAAIAAYGALKPMKPGQSIALDSSGSVTFNNQSIS